MLTDKDPDKTKEMLGQLKADTDEALETLRDVARRGRRGAPAGLTAQVVLAPPRGRGLGPELVRTAPCVTPALRVHNASHGTAT
jgi:hypothetical protein